MVFSWERDLGPGWTGWGASRSGRADLTGTGSRTHQVSRNLWSRRPVLVANENGVPPEPTPGPPRSSEERGLVRDGAKKVKIVDLETWDCPTEDGTSNIPLHQVLQAQNAPRFYLHLPCILEQNTSIGQRILCTDRTYLFFFFPCFIFSDTLLFIPSWIIFSSHPI